MKSKTRICLQVLVLLAGCLLLAYGVYRGEAETIWQKAIFICYECIGIG